MRGRAGTTFMCWRCAVRHGPMLRRSILAAVVVGTIVTAINQGDTLVSGSRPSTLAWKIPLSYVVPFFVAAWGALMNARR